MLSTKNITFTLYAVWAVLLQPLLLCAYGSFAAIIFSRYSLTVKPNLFLNFFIKYSSSPQPTALQSSLKEELLATAMARDGLFGEIVYCHGAYMHDLRDQVAYGEKERHYRNGEYSNYCRDNYPTHDLGPIAKLIGINRGNRMVSLSSRASKARGINEFAKTKDDLAEMATREFRQGDIVETIITCENGELINLRLDTTLPTYYSREFTVRGTKRITTVDCYASDIAATPEWTKLALRTGSGKAQSFDENSVY